MRRMTKGWLAAGLLAGAGITMQASSHREAPGIARYADNHIYSVNIPGCAAGSRLFVGQRREGFVVNLAEAFDLINTNPLGPVNGEENTLADKNVTTLGIEVLIGHFGARFWYRQRIVLPASALIACVAVYWTIGGL